MHEDELSPAEAERTARKLTRRGLYALGGIAIAGGALWVVGIATEGRMPEAISNTLITLGVLQLILAIVVVLVALVGLIRRQRPEPVGLYVGGIVGSLVLGFFGLVGAFFALISGAGGLALGGAWGRPLRVKGVQIHPELERGSEWASGPAPHVDDLDARTKAALGALWHFDAQKEHASVPAFSRISWVLTALGAPAELVHDAHVSAMQEIDHARRCFALAAGYLGVTHTAKPMPEMLGEGLGLGANPLETLALESLKDGCLTEAFNADIAELAATRATDRAAKTLAQIIAKDERMHAEVSWRILAWCLERGDTALRVKVRRLAEVLPEDGPTAYAPEHLPVVEGVEVARLEDHGRVAAHEWRPRYLRRKELTRRRALALVDAFELKAA